MDVEEVHVGIQEHESSAPMTVQSDDESEEELDAYAFDIDLYPAGDEGTGFHTTDDPRKNRQWHREQVLQRKGAISTRCDMTDVAHGKWESNGNGYATLAVFSFRFDTRKGARRISRAEVTIDFYGGSEDDPCSRPEVQAISFERAINFFEKRLDDTTTKAVEGTAELAAFSAKLSGKATNEHTESREIKSYTRLVGNKYNRANDAGPDDQANWVLLEDELHRTGVPSTFRAGVLLRRKDNAPFECRVKIKMKANLRQLFEDFMGFKNVNPVFFNPLVKAEKSATLQEVKDVDLNALGAFDIDAVGHLEQMRIRHGAVQHENC